MWGNHHKLALISAPLVLAVIAGQEPQSWPIGGSTRTLNMAFGMDLQLDLGPIQFDASPYVFGGPSWRQIIDFSHIENSYGILPGGTSGNPLNPHYIDQVPYFVEGNYKNLIFHSEATNWIEGDIISTQRWGKV